MSHPDPLFDPDNAMEDDVNYDDHNDFYQECEDYNDYYIEENTVDDDSYDDSMDGDHESALASAGWGTDEDYGYYGEDVDYHEDFHSDDGYGYYDDGE